MHRAMASFRNLIKLCRFSKTESDNQQLPVQQVEYLGKAVDVVVVMPYGVHANVPVDMLGVLLQLSTQEQNRVVLPLSLKERPKPLESGEIVVYHPLTDSEIRFKNDGNIDITVDGDLNIVADNVNITAAETTINGNLTVTGTTTLGATVTSNGKDISDTHQHSQANDSAGNSQEDTDGVL